MKFTSIDFLTNINSFSGIFRNEVEKVKAAGPFIRVSIF